VIFKTTPISLKDINSEMKCRYGWGFLGGGANGAVLVGLLCGFFVCNVRCDKVEIIELGNWTITNQNRCEFN